MIPIKIVIFEDNSNLRQCLTYLLNNAEGFVVTGDYGNCLDTVNIVTGLKPHVVLMDIDMPG